MLKKSVLILAVLLSLQAGATRAAGITSFISATDTGNGRLIAKPVGLGMDWIAEWDAGVEFCEGAGQFAGDKIHYGLLWCVAKA